MVLIAAAVCTKAGKTLISRQFVEMTKARIEGLLAAFPKLMSTGKQHTFVETDSVRYVYQPLEKLYMVLITTKNSNILEDLETLRLFSRVIPDFCRSMDESEIAISGFDLIFAFDEIVALGYRESVNLSQIRTYVEMDSHEEKVYQAVRQTQEREAKNKMREKAKELQRLRMEAGKKGVKPSSVQSMGGFGPSSTYSNPIVETPVEPSNSYPYNMKSNVSVNAMKLGGKSRDVESFVDQLVSEGERVVSPQTSAKPVTTKLPVTPIANTEEVHLKQEEKIVVKVGRDGGVQTFELHGLVTLRITNEKWARIRIGLDNNDTRGIQLQTHPNVDKELFKSKSKIGLKNPSKPFPLDIDVGVLKWRYQTQDESALPLTINCWPSENGQGGCDVNIEYGLEHRHLELNDVTISIPLPIGCSPVVTECDGEYKHESRRNLLQWILPVIDNSNKTGVLEFSAGTAIPSDFFPLSISFVSKSPYADLKAVEVLMVDDDSPVKYSSETVFYTDKYDIV
ncbi:coatomer subunit delta [Cimex lectularius]|uniref:Coatomer subunit delta n=1 Tax=Cimex lectularius TaxID=79782 RepID=A0A8I6RYZ7_CIMLE|nr:coatomer subunit delta [Cimex lectularius]